ncbi:hypothetical protein [uncultured Anaerotruncus sp.]|uniref:hypothetical protein n=1 Tax=uncultured Anaerotruncus sp. TaxID=905011 RepID=UPI00280C017D|nr:hypothetical protein [uncultured Anaerotruncus sp.]
MMKRVFGILLAAALLLGAAGCGAKEREESAAERMRQNLSQSFQTTARVRYGELETEMTIYKKPMNCAVVTFQSPESIRDIKMTFFTDKVTVQYGDLSFDFTPDSVPGKAASKMILSALNAALNDQGVRFEEREGKLVVTGAIEEGEFSLVIDGENGNILKLSIPQNDFEAEILNFRILE